MAVENKYVDAKIAAGKLADAAQVFGRPVQALVQTFEVAAADDNGSMYRIGYNLNPNLIPIDIKVFNDALTGGTDWDLGLYKSNLGAVISKDVFADGLDFSSAAAIAAPKNGLAAVDIANLERRLYEWAGHTVANKEGGYDLVLTANTVGSAAGTVTVVALFVQG